MLINNNGILAGFIIFTLCHTASASTSTTHPSTNQSEQDRARQAALAPQQQAYKSSQEYTAEGKILFPKESQCKYISEVNIESENNALTQKLLGKLVLQAKGQCLGIEGIRLLSRSLQNELITQG
ncbi:MAG: ShlB/FhaC/HecB family hemolysin secretion/activation protein, partial [Leclercia sp.]